MELIAQKREKFGTDAARNMRRVGTIPAELYGHGTANLHLQVSAKEFNKVLKEAGESTVVTILIDGDKRPVLIYDVRTDPIKDEVIHADFYQVRMDEKLKARIPVVLEGIAPGVKEKGGVLTHAMREIEVEALPADLVHDIKVDISGLDDIGKSIHVSDFPVLHGILYLAEPETVVASISARVEEVVEVAPPSIEDVKVEGEEKRKEKEAAVAEMDEAPKAQAKEEPKKEKK